MHMSFLLQGFFLCLKIQYMHGIVHTLYLPHTHSDGILQIVPYNCNLGYEFQSYIRTCMYLDLKTLPFGIARQCTVPVSLTDE